MVYVSGNIYAMAFVQEVDVWVVEGLPCLARKYNENISYMHGGLGVGTGGYSEDYHFKIYVNKS